MKLLTRFLLIADVLLGIENSILVRSSFAKPVRNAATSAQKMLITVKRVKSNGVILKNGLQVTLVSTKITWEYVKESGVSIPFIDLYLNGIPWPNHFTVLAQHSSNLKPDSSGKYIFHMPLMRRESTGVVTIVDQSGIFEDWKIQVDTNIEDTAIYVDETCFDYVLRIRELSRGNRPNLIFMGCRMKPPAKDPILGIMWDDTGRLVWQGKAAVFDNKDLGYFFQLSRAGEHKYLIEGVGTEEGSGKYELSYEPELPSPYALSLNLGVVIMNFAQSNFASTYNQFAPALLARFAYDPPDVNLSFAARATANFFSFSQSLTPSVSYDENVQNYFFDVYSKYKVFKKNGWKVEPMFGVWSMFMVVQSQLFGIERAIDPMFGISVQKLFPSIGNFDLSLRYVPLLEYIDPSTITLNKTYFEPGLTYARPMSNGMRVFGAVSYGMLIFSPTSSGVRSTGNYLTITAGYGW